MTPEEFVAMTTEIRKIEEAMGQPFYGVSKDEESSVVFRRSIFTVDSVKEGENPTDKNVRIKSTNGNIEAEIFKKY